MNNFPLKLKTQKSQGLRLNVFRRYTAASLSINWTLTLRAQSNCFGVNIQLSFISLYACGANVNSYEAENMLQIPVKVTPGTVAALAGRLSGEAEKLQDFPLYGFMGFWCACSLARLLAPHVQQS